MAGETALFRGVVHSWHLDHFGHMNVRHYAPFFDDAAFHMWARLGLPLSQMQACHGVHTVTGTARTVFLRELVAGDLFRIDGKVTAIGSKSVTFKLEMRHVDSGTLHATCEVTEVFFDPATRRSAPIPPEIRTRLQDGASAG